MSDTAGAVERWIADNTDLMIDPEGVQVDAIPWGRLQTFARAHDAEDARRDAALRQAREALDKGIPAGEANSEPFRVDPPASIRRGDEGGSVRVEREDARRSGWHFVDGRDVCDQCWEAGRR